MVKILHGNISNATKACDSLVRDLESRKNQFKKLQDLWHDQQDLSYYSQVFVSPRFTGKALSRWKFWTRL